MAKSEEGKGWVDYKWLYPGSEDITDKTSYLIKNDKDFICGVGAYKPAEAVPAADSAQVIIHSFLSGYQESVPANF